MVSLSLKIPTLSNGMDTRLHTMPSDHNFFTTEKIKLAFSLARTTLPLQDEETL